ncbi:helix-turn-helix transcriptional regulator [Lyngbya confervoides]|uniref:WYL domain-containing protein n=1 Tax=Lyngbya confervoides BDU141951 TaxID=1574623 RepID=A0ABD4T7M6_9CYAN|nr:WYL domain-containing protein [Lyngbya confervoides]MCM1984440.1 WYL domain-containing protein [Lyngbya confervoides BDU141951]
MPRKKETLTLSVPPGTKNKLDAIAARLGIKWGERPSPSGLVSAIADSSLYVGSYFSFSREEIEALQQAIRALIDSGQPTLAKSVVTLLLNYAHLEAPLRQELIQTASHPLDGWRIQVDQYRDRQQPFRVLYANSQGKILEFTVRYAEVQFHEKRDYLQIWCDETEDSLDLPELKHNRCLRLERIQGILEATGEWRGSFNSIPVQLRFTKEMIAAYKAKAEDTENEVIEADVQKQIPPYRRVTRQIVNPFWLIREILRYGSSCEVIHPPAIRDRLKNEIQKTLQHYL